MTEPQKTHKSLTGRKVLLMVVVFFAVIFIANAFMISLAVTSFRGEDTKKSYLQGLHYNETLEKRAAQTATGWTAELDYSEDQVQLAIRDAQNKPVSRLEPTGKLRHPTDTSLDLDIVFEPTGLGKYTAALPAGLKGQRILITRTPTRDGFDFETRNELWLR